MSSSRLRWALVASVIAVIAVSFTAVSQSRPSKASGAVKTHATAADLAYVKAQIAKAKAIPKFVVPGPAFDAKKAAGKTVFNIPIASTIPFVNTIDKAMQAVAKKVGVKFIEFPTQGQPSQWVTGINQAIAQKVDLIDLQAAPNPYFLQPQLKAAKKAGIPVTVTHLFDIHQAFPPNVTALVPIDFTTAARWEADWAILKTNGHANVFIIKSAEVVPSNAIVAAIQDELKTRCGTACKSKVVNVPVTDWATKIQSEVQSALTADPGINYVIPIYDSMSQFAAPGITAAGKVGKVHIATFNGTPFVMKMLQTGNIVDFEVGENLDWIGYGNMDQNMRILAGLKPVKTEHLALRAFTKDNIKQAGTPPAVNVGYGSAYIKGYEKLWGLSK
jgi:ribose transport system substrate-binding protein